MCVTEKRTAKSIQYATKEFPNSEQVIHVNRYWSSDGKSC